MSLSPWRNSGPIRSAGSAAAHWRRRCWSPPRSGSPPTYSCRPACGKRSWISLLPESSRGRDSAAEVTQQLEQGIRFRALRELVRELEHGTRGRSEGGNVVRRCRGREPVVFRAEVKCVSRRQGRCRIPLRAKARILLVEGPKQAVEPEIVVTAVSPGPVPRNARSPSGHDAARD